MDYIENVKKLVKEKQEYVIMNGKFKLNNVLNFLEIIKELEHAKWRLPNKTEISDLFKKNPSLLDGARWTGSPERYETPERRYCDGMGYWTEEYAEKRPHVKATIYYPEITKNNYYSYYKGPEKFETMVDHWHSGLRYNVVLVKDH